MNYPRFTSIRRLIDNAITFNDIEEAKKLAVKGLKMANEKEILSEKMFFLAQLEIIKGNFEKAIDYLDRTIKFNPKDGAAYNDRALCMIETGKLDGAIEYFNKGISVEPDYETIYHNKGWFLNKLGYYNEALELFKKVLEMDKKRAVTYENMANVYENLGLIKKAIEHYKKALQFTGPSYLSIKGQIILEIERLEKIKS